MVGLAGVLPFNAVRRGRLFSFGRHHAAHALYPADAILALVASCTHNRRDMGPAHAPIVTADDIERSPGTPIEQIIESKIPGIQVTRSIGGGIVIRIHGISSFYSNNDPLYVIDGTPMEPGPGGALTGVNPYDIETIRVLKDPAETGIYGVRGANGVIVVTTKRPGGHEKPSA
jgi:TonB-dependent SusC/RagA subfamily outer membrane receptor